MFHHNITIGVRVMQMVQVEVTVPSGYENVVKATAAALCRGQEAVALTNTTKAMKVTLGAVRERLYGAPYSQGNPNMRAVEQLCRDVGSRARNVFVEVSGVEWPVKALYFVVFNALAPGMGQVPYDHPTDFNTLAAISFFESIGIKIIKRVKGSESGDRE